MFWSTRNEIGLAHLAYFCSSKIPLGVVNSALVGADMPIPSAIMEAASWGETFSLITRLLIPPPKAIKGTWVS